ncbi:MAG TPA: prepilin-type N-terminal cleavage/methylation domain-containing protein [Polyangiaceae bacterium]|nr:prepilin-type N-terminal cleavage/methylation domain-containing protein [Polyangiaceae bacterium]
MRRRWLRGFTLLELLVAISILAMISMLIYSAFASMRRSKEGLERVSDRYREGRLAMQRISRELQSAYLSLHVPENLSLVMQKTAFIGTRGNPADRIDFNAFANVRRDRDSHESDQAELSYFGSPNPNGGGTVDLVRRISTRLDLEPARGGRIEVLATDIDLFEVEYLDSQTGLWSETWDSTQPIGQPNRLPYQVRFTLVLNSGRRVSAGSGRDRIRLMSTVALPIQQPLSFAASQP